MAPGSYGSIARRQHDGAHVEIDLGVALAVQQGAGPAGAHALHALGTDGALQAALGLGDRLLFGVAVAHLDPAAAAFGAGLLGHVHARLGGDLGQRLVVGPGFVQRVRPQRDELLAAQVVVDAGGALASGGDRLDGGQRAGGGHVAAGEHGRMRGGQRIGLDGDRVPLDLDVVETLGEVVDDRLADGEDDRLAGDLDEVAGDGLGTPAALLVGLAEPAALQLDGAHLAAGADDLDRGDEVLDLDLLVEALFDLLARRRHLVAAAPVGDGDLGGLAAGGGEARGAARRVEGHVAAADDDHAVADRHGPAEVELAQELDCREAAVEVVALGRRRGAGVQAGGQEDGLVAVGQQAVDGEVDAAALVEAQVDAQGADLVDLALQDVLRHAMVGDADAQHAAGHRQRLEDRGGVAVLGQVAGAAQAGRAAADDGDLLVEGDGQLLGQVGGGAVVAGEALEAGDGDGLVDRAARAGRLAGVRADAAADRREGVGLGGDAVGVFKAALGDEGDVALGRGLDRAVALAGGVALLVDHVGAGDGLRIQLVDGLALAEAFVVLVADRDGADRDALAAARAHIGVDEARVVVHLGAEVAGLALETGELGVGDDLDVEVPAGFDQLRRQRTHRTVVGGEGLVELRHVAAEGRRLLDQIDLVPPLGQVEGTLDAGDASAQHEGSAGGLGGCARHTHSF